MSINLSQNINLEKHVELIIEQLILLNKKIESLEIKINFINNKPIILNLNNNNLNVENIDWESVLYY
jgi:hypothetical protein